MHSFLWGRYSGSTESVLNRDLGVIEDVEGGIDRLIEELRQNRGDLHLHPEDFLGWSRSARFYPLLYMLTRVGRVLDLDTGIELKKNLLGKNSSLELHHIFPKALLYKAGYKRPDVNALANFTFLTKETNLNISDKDPTVYLTAYADKNPELLSSHWMPLDPELWHLDRYEDFLTARRELLAGVANDFLSTLRHGEVPEEAEEVHAVGREPEVVPSSIGEVEDEDRLIEVNQWVMEHGLPKGEFRVMF